MNVWIYRKPPSFWHKISPFFLLFYYFYISESPTFLLLIKSFESLFTFLVISAFLQLRKKSAKLWFTQNFRHIPLICVTDLYFTVPWFSIFIQVCLYGPSYPTSVSASVKAPSYPRHRTGASVSYEHISCYLSIHKRQSHQLSSF